MRRIGMTDPHAEARRIAEEAHQWRMWATGERRTAPHNLLAFTTDVIAQCAREERLQEMADSWHAAMKASHAREKRLLSINQSQRDSYAILEADKTWLVLENKRLREALERLVECEDIPV